MKRGQLLGGVLMLLAGATFLLFVEGDSSLPVAIALLVVGIALIAASRQKAL